MPIKSISLNNFRIFSEETKFDLAAITIFTGPNNSGKSTAIKALKLLVESAEQTSLKTLLSKGTDTNLTYFPWLLNNKSDISYIEFKLEITDEKINEILGSGKVQVLLCYSAEYNIGKLEKFVVVTPEYGEVLSANIGAKYDNELIISSHWVVENRYDEVRRKNFIDPTNSEYYDDENGYPGFTIMYQDGLHPDECAEIDDSLKNELKKTNFILPFHENEYDLIEAIKSAKISYGLSQGRDMIYVPKAMDDFISHISLGFSQGVYKSYTRLYFKIFEELYEVFKEIVDSIKKLFDDKYSYLPTNRNEPLREFSRSDSNALSKKLFQIIDHNRQLTHTGSIRSTSKKNSVTPLFVFSNEVISKIYGIGNSISFRVNSYNGNYELMMISDEFPDGCNIANYGYGVYQLIVLLAHIDYAASDYYKTPSLLKTIKFDERKSSHTILIEEPELSLHPNFQSKLADVFALAYKKYGVRFIIETHSEYLIRRLQFITANNKSDSKLDTKDSVIYYLASPEKVVNKKEKQVTKINIMKDGGMSDSFGEGFYDEAIGLQLDLLNLKNLN